MIICIQAFFIYLEKRVLLNLKIDSMKYITSLFWSDLIKFQIGEYNIFLSTLVTRFIVRQILKNIYDKYIRIQYKKVTYEQC